MIFRSLESKLKCGGPSVACHLWFPRGRRLTAVPKFRPFSPPRNDFSDPQDCTADRDAPTAPHNCHRTL